MFPFSLAVPDTRGVDFIFCFMSNFLIPERLIIIIGGNSPGLTRVRITVPALNILRYVEVYERQTRFVDIPPTAAAVGSTVEIRSLVSRPSMNGKVGVVVSANASTARFGVRVAGEAKALALRRAMQWSPPDSPDPLLNT